MKLPIVEALHTVPTGRKFQLTTHLSFAAMSSEPDRPFRLDAAEEVQSKATFEMRQLSREPRETMFLHDRARRVMIEEIYGPVTKRLHEIMVMLWEEGPRYDDKIVQAIEQLMEDLK